LFRIERVSKNWSFWSVIKTNLLSYSCFFLLLIEVELGALLVTLLEEEEEDIRSIGVESKEKEEEEAEIEGFFFSFSA